ncbi:putative non-specific polyamine oxidase [Helianthus anomalus]
MFFRYALFNIDRNQVPHELVSQDGKTFETILEEALILSYLFNLFSSEKANKLFHIILHIYLFVHSFIIVFFNLAD